MNINKIYKVKGMHCASCASIIERTVKKIDGVESIEVNPGTENAKISFDELKVNLEILNQKLEPLGYSLIIETPIARTVLASPESENVDKCLTNFFNLLFLKYKL